MSGTFGDGLGLDYGGLEGQLNIRLHPVAAIFGSIGYMISGVGYNAGAKFRVLPKSKICPTITAMSGHNAAIFMENIESANMLYFGSTVRKDSNNYLSFQ